MEKQLLIDWQPAKPKPIWKTWKWIGLALFALVILLKRWLPGGLITIGHIYGTIVLINLVFLLFRRLRDRLFWRVRNRLLAAFVFSSLIPLTLIIGMIFASGWMLAGQLSANYLYESLRDLAGELSTVNHQIGQKFGSKSPEELEAIAGEIFKIHKSRFPNLEAYLFRKDQKEGFVVLQSIGGSKPANSSQAGFWKKISGKFENVLNKGERLFITSVQPIYGANGLFLEISAPIDEHIQRRLAAEKSIYARFQTVGRTRVNRKNREYTVSMDDRGAEAERAEEEKQSNLVRELRRNDARSMASWGMVPDFMNFETGKIEAATFIVINVPFRTLYGAYFAGNSEWGYVILFSLAIMIILLGMAELGSMVIGIAISRKITQSIHDMYQGMLALKDGNLQHRIPVRRHDQIGLLAHSFNQMSASITHLLEEVSEKKRLEQELEIARQVQATLFPKQLPQPKGLKVFGGCLPAQVVSGDYYDFIAENESRFHIVVADISGKGISAALLMANLQAAMRNQLMSFKQAGQKEMEKVLALVMSELNNQVYRNSPSEKYASLFSSVYDGDNRTLCYCNAGHLPPILISNGNTMKLESGGMVLGLFPEASYSAETVRLPPGALLAIYTDGITEAANEKDEEYGEERLQSVLKESRSQPPEVIYATVVERVRQWQGSLKQQDDMTLIITKAE
jgi:phosphoserine phosphatase RsbU/P